MLNFIKNQSQQYEAYTDRYLAFKVELRKEIPYKKSRLSYLLDAEKAISKMAQLGWMANIALTMMLKQSEHQRFLNHAKSYLSEQEWSENAFDINQITSDNYGRFINLIIDRKISVRSAIKLLPLLKALYEEYLIDTCQWIYSRKSYIEIEDLIGTTSNESFTPDELKQKTYE